MFIRPMSHSLCNVSTNTLKRKFNVNRLASFLNSNVLHTRSLHIAINRSSSAQRITSGRRFGLTQSASRTINFLNLINPHLQSHHRLISSGPKNNSALSDFQIVYSKKNLHSCGGHESALHSLSDLVRYLQNPQEFSESGIKPPKGVILSGPPGVGKTFLAEAVAGHAAVPLFLVSGAEFSQPYSGQAEERLRNLFKKAVSMAPCVICIDEIDSIGGKRFASQSDPSYRSDLTNQLLTLLTQEMPGVVVIGTTNHFDKLDPALVRPGRFDRNIVLSNPNCTDRERILEIYLKNQHLDSSISIKKLAQISVGFSGAKIASWVNESLLCAKRDSITTLNERCFDQARSFLNAGVIATKSINPMKKQQAAIHETGHALVGHLLNRKLYKVSINVGNDKGGVTEWLLEEDFYVTKQYMLDTICISLAGRAAELLYGNPQIGSRGDLKTAKNHAYIMVNEEGMGSTLSGHDLDIEVILQEQMNRAQALLKGSQNAFNLLVQALIKYDELFEQDFLNIVEGKALEIITNTSHTKRTLDQPLMLPPVSEPKNREEQENKIQKVQSIKNLDKFDNDSNVLLLKKILYKKKEIAKLFNLEESTFRFYLSFGKLYITLLSVIKTDEEKKALIESMRSYELKLKKYGITSQYIVYLDQLIIESGFEKFNELLEHGWKEEKESNVENHIEQKENGVMKIYKNRDELPFSEGQLAKFFSVSDFDLDIRVNSAGRVLVIFRRPSCDRLSFDDFMIRAVKGYEQEKIKCTYDPIYKQLVIDPSSIDKFNECVQKFCSIV